MFEAIILLEVSTIPKDENLEEGEIRLQEIAKYNFDPGLQRGNHVMVTDLKLGTRQDEPFSFEALVKNRTLEIAPGTQGQKDIFRILIQIEAVEKEYIARIAEIMKRMNPGKFKD
ncbi:MAG: hypothetical protein RM021_016350 [Nostoc sp. EkiNYC01]|nr:hypothetical protein [Nostoc sp. EkiNYC01]